MKRIAIVTITNSGMNFGNRLQNYALQYVLEACSANVQTIFSAKSMWGSLFLSRLRRFAKAILKKDGRRRCFNSFDKAYIKKSPKVRYEKINEQSFDRDYDAFIAGSDQVWNPEFHFNSEFEFLTFADPSKRFSYAASFGVSGISDKHKKDYAQMLSSMRLISVREDEGREIVKQLTGKDAMVHIDPTMLLGEDHYAAMERMPKANVPEKYVLAYFLGKKKSEYVSFSEDVAEKLQAKVLQLSESPGTPFYDIGPLQFIYLLRHSEYICTDSFHGTVFAILFRKRFTTFYRKKSSGEMHSRINTLLKKLRLQDRLYGVLGTDDSIKELSYDEVEKCLEQERVLALEYLNGIVE